MFLFPHFRAANIRIIFYLSTKKLKFSTLDCLITLAQFHIFVRSCLGKAGAVALILRTGHPRNKPARQIIYVTYETYSFIRGDCSRCARTGGCWSQPSLKTDTITESGNYASMKAARIPLLRKSRSRFQQAASRRSSLKECAKTSQRQCLGKDTGHLT